MRQNCWDVMKCGRQPGGDKVEELGVCPAAKPSKYDGVNNGIHAGRFCWAISGTFCDGKPKGSYARQLTECFNCDFLRQVNREEGLDFILTRSEIGERLN